jgi:hypothetical protein
MKTVAESPEKKNIVADYMVETFCDLESFRKGLNLFASLGYNLHSWQDIGTTEYTITAVFFNLAEMTKTATIAAREVVTEIEKTEAGYL